MGEKYTDGKCISQASGAVQTMYHGKDLQTAGLKSSQVVKIIVLLHKMKTFAIAFA